MQTAVEESRNTKDAQGWHDFEAVEKFISRVYNAANAEGCNEARAALFFWVQIFRGTSPNKRCSTMTYIWGALSSNGMETSPETNPTLPLPETMGWTKSDDEKLVPKLMTLTPVPGSCTEVITGGCKSGFTISS